MRKNNLSLTTISLLMLFAIPSLAEDNTPIIPDGYDHTLAFSPIKRTHADAEEFCKKNGFSLPLISDFANWRKMHTEEEHELLGAGRYWYWTGEEAADNGKVPRRHFYGRSGSKRNPTRVEGTVCLIPEQSGELKYALASGDASVITDPMVYWHAVIDDIDERRGLYDKDLAQIFDLNADGTLKPSSLVGAMWNPSRKAHRLKSTFGINYPLFVSNAAYQGQSKIEPKELGVIGKNANAKYMVLASNPMNTEYKGYEINEAFWDVIKSSINWLIDGKDTTKDRFNVVVSKLADSRNHRDATQTRQWLKATYGERVNLNEDIASCSGHDLASCINSSTDLLIISQYLDDIADAENVLSIVTEAQKQGVAVLYMDHDGNGNEFSDAFFASVNIKSDGNNYWSRQGIYDYDISQKFDVIPEQADSLYTLAKSFTNGFSFNVGSCSEHGSNCDIPEYQTEFKKGALAAQGIANDFDNQKTNIFKSNSPDYQKLAVLAADAHRQQVIFPLNYKTTDTHTFLGSLYSDHVQHIHRDLNPAQPDLGNYSRSDFSHVTPAVKNINIISGSPFRAAGVYALPGQPFKVTRVDTSEETKTSIRIGTVRSGSTYLFSNRRDYNRPKFLTSTSVPLAIGESITLTSPYGGPIQIDFKGENGVDIQLDFEQVGLHPYWSSELDSAQFQQGIEAGDFDWAEISTPGFEVHSTVDKMRKSLDSTLWPTASMLAEATEKYTYNYPHQLAGFIGDGIDEVDEVKSFANEKGWGLQTLDKVKHMNADQSTCGYGCSGNPYDASWSFDPIGHGDIHELGHGLEKSRMRFNGAEGHSSTNFYVFFTKYKHYQNTGILPNCKALPFDSLYEQLQTAIRTNDPVEYMRQNISGSWRVQNVIYMQAMMHAQRYGSVEDGWSFYARLHTAERAFSNAISSESNWLDMKASFGMETLSLEEAKALDNDSWLTVIFAVISGLDFTDYLQLWGIQPDSQSISLVRSMHLPKVPTDEYFQVNGGDYCTSLDFSTLPLNGTTEWEGGDRNVTITPDSGSTFELFDVVDGNVIELPIINLISWAADDVGIDYQYEVYFGNNYELVNEATSRSEAFVGRYHGDGEYFLDLDRTEKDYYYRVDVYSNSSYVKGQVKTFSITNKFNSDIPQVIDGKFDNTLAVMNNEKKYFDAKAFCEYYGMEMPTSSQFRKWRDFSYDYEVLESLNLLGFHWANSDHMEDGYAIYRSLTSGGGNNGSTERERNTVCKVTN
ncbi:ImpA family metalloprotease [Vibrio mediterranei]|uniref:ImpA family metalloprotease n=1 Tax=Vibrio mediterranei TaxID=689 RepID=UPI0038CEB4CD